MPAPSTSAEFVELVRRSTVADESRLSAYLEPLREGGSMPEDPAKIAGLLVRDGVITLFQAEQLLQGKWKRFTIGKYKVLERLGSGGMGQVFLCEHKLMRRRVAVKVLPTARAEDPASLERFYREARVVAALDHPNLVRAFDIDKDGELHFLVMEYVDGVSFQDLVKKFGPLDPLRACHYTRQAAVGLEYAHEVANLVHRDVKPGNVLVDRAGVVKILDMGLARFFNDETDVLTRKYDENVLGTADYLAPEQAIDSHSVDVRADIYSLGATLYFLLTGRPPFPDGTVAQKLIWHQTKEPTSLRELRPDLSAEVIAVVETMMRKSPADRYQTPVEVTEALKPLSTAAIPPPAETEMPLLSLAAMAGGNTASITMRLRQAAANAKPARAARGQPNAKAERPATVGLVTASDGECSPLPSNPFRSLLGPGSSTETHRSLLQSIYSPTTMARPVDERPGHSPSHRWQYVVGIALVTLAGAAGTWAWLR